jgi:hypothetical protein
MEEYMAYGLFPLSASFGVGEVTNEETPVSKLAVPMPNFHVAKLPEEMNDDFCARVELAVVNIVGWYACGEHKVCVEVVPNQGRVNRVFERADVPYRPRLEPGFEACEETTKKRKQDVGAGPSAKCVKVSGRKAAPAKPPAVSIAVSDFLTAFEDCPVEDCGGEDHSF